MSSDIPVIDISNPSPEVAKEVLSAATTHGFLFIQNDGKTIPPSDIATMFDLSKSFFSQPPTTKSSYAIHSPTAGGTNRGWVHMSGESLDPTNKAIKGDPKEAFNIAPPTSTTPLQPLPPPLSAHADLITRFQANCHALCVRILDLLGTALGVSEEGYFGTRHGEGEAGTIFRMLYYPGTRTPGSGSGNEATSIRAGAHSDYGSLTLLFRLPGQPGLELLTADDTWVPVPVDPIPESSSSPPILVNIGDLLCYWTNGLLKSTVHRVVFAGGEERYSMAYFCHPLDEVRLESVESEVIREFGEKGREELERQRKRVGVGEGEEGVLTAREHLERRLKVTYGI